MTSQPCCDLQSGSPPRMPLLHEISTCLTRSPLQELAIAHACLMEDAKNYHVWAHRQVAVRLAGLWQAELDYASQVIAEDVRNNSAWNQRMFALRGLQCASHLS